VKESEIFFDQSEDCPKLRFFFLGNKIAHFTAIIVKHVGWLEYHFFKNSLSFILSNANSKSELFNSVYQKY